MLNYFRVLVETGIVREFLREMWLAGELFVLAFHLSGCPQYTVGDSDAISGNEARVGLGELFLEMRKEGPPLISDNLLPSSVLLRGTIKAEDDIGVGCDQIAPSVYNPVNQASLLPIGRIIVAFLNADGTKGGSGLLHFSALVADDRQLSHLSRIATGLPHGPSWQADSVFSPLSVAVVQEDSEGLSSSVYLEVRDSDDSWVRWTTSTGVSHYVLFYSD